MVLGWRGLLLSLAGVLAAGQTQAPVQRLEITVVEGEGAINNITAHSAREPVVRVLDQGGKPVPAALVTFTLPSSGPGGTFLAGDRTLTIPASADGLARATGLRPNKSAGAFEIRVSASKLGDTGQTVIHQTNAVASTGSKAKKKIIVATVVAGAVAAGIVAGTQHGGSSSTPLPSPVSIVPGSPSFGPPR